MAASISQSERLDIFLALATIYKDESIEIDEANSGKSQIDIALQSMSAIGDDEFKLLEERAKRFEVLSREKQNTWQTFWLEKLKNRGQTQRLDENIHPEHIAEVLKNEPTTVQGLIFEHLPKDVADEIELLLPDIKMAESHFASNNSKVKEPDNEISNLVRTSFLSNFVAIEDIYKTNEIDELDCEQLEDFIWHLGIRETAISCRGIKTKENLAVFLKPFKEEVTKEIALKITELEEIEPRRVLYAEKFVKEAFKFDEDSNQKIVSLGLQVLATILASSDNNSQQFNVKKLSLEMSQQLSAFIKEFENEFNKANDENLEYLDEIKSEVLTISAQFKDE